MIRTCPTCKKANCGNHAACARRKARECPRCFLSPCYEDLHCIGSWKMWYMIGGVENLVNRHADVFADYKERLPERQFLSMCREAMGQMLLSEWALHV